MYICEVFHECAQDPKLHICFWKVTNYHLQLGLRDSCWAYDYIKLQNSQQFQCPCMFIYFLLLLPCSLQKNRISEISLLKHYVILISLKICNDALFQYIWCSWCYSLPYFGLTSISLQLIYYCQHILQCCVIDASWLSNSECVLCSTVPEHLFSFMLQSSANITQPHFKLLKLQCRFKGNLFFYYHFSY